MDEASTTVIIQGYLDALPGDTAADLDPLRQRDDFRKLVAELEGKGK